MCRSDRTDVSDLKVSVSALASVSQLIYAAARKRSRGERCEGRKPFGTLPGESETLLRIRELKRKPPHGKRRSLQQVCDALNAEARPTRTGKLWTKQVVNGFWGGGRRDWAQR
jgi:hypothetical protein